MAVPRYRWAAVDEFRDRTNALAELESWWASASRDPVNLYGRRRVGKSWLFRRLAHGKPAVVLVAERAATGPQLTRMAAQLADVLGVRPALDDVADLFEVLGTRYGAGDGSTTFNIPDLRGRIAVGPCTHTDVNALGDATSTATQRPPGRNSARQLLWPIPLSVWDTK